jgi:AsmA protein
VSTAANWRRVTLPTDWFGDMNADIRLSANSAKLGELAATNAAASVSLRDGRLEVGLAQAAFSGGSLAGNIAVTNAPDAAAIEAQLHANDVAFALAPPTLGLPHAVSGTASVLVDVTTKGHDLGAFLSQLTGTARISVKDGAVPLFGLADVAAAVGGPANPQPAEGFAAVAVDSASAGFSFSGGVGMLQRASVVTHAYSADMQGWIGLLDGTLGLNGAIKAVAGGSTTSPAPQPIAFTIDGTLAAPMAHSQEAAGPIPTPKPASPAPPPTPAPAN